MRRLRAPRRIRGPGSRCRPGWRRARAVRSRPLQEFRRNRPRSSRDARQRPAPRLNRRCEHRRRPTHRRCRNPLPPSNRCRVWIEARRKLSTRRSSRASWRCCRRKPSRAWISRFRGTSSRRPRPRCRFQFRGKSKLRCQSPQHRHGQLGQRLQEARQGAARPPRALVGGDVHSTGRRKAFVLRVPAAPGHAQQHPDQGLQRPARRGIFRTPRLVGLLPDLRREEMP